MSHLHWDHIMGFPFYPVHPRPLIRIYGCHELGTRFAWQQAPLSFPVDFSRLGAH